MRVRGLVLCVNDVPCTSNIRLGCLIHTLDIQVHETGFKVECMRARAQTHQHISFAVTACAHCQLLTLATNLGILYLHT